LKSFSHRSRPTIYELCDQELLQVNQYNNQPILTSLNFPNIWPDLSDNYFFNRYFAKVLMPKKNAAQKVLKSFRLCREGIWQLCQLASEMGRSQSNVIEVALDRMYREESRYRQIIPPENNKYSIDK
jgi:hypothetical protein